MFGARNTRIKRDASATAIKAVAVNATPRADE
jgi:hypothetical protein